MINDELYAQIESVITEPKSDAVLIYGGNP